MVALCRLRSALAQRERPAKPTTRQAEQRLEQLIPANNATLSRVLAVEEHGRQLYEAAQRLDLEGIVAKRKADPYSSQTIWYKVKNPAYTRLRGEGTCSTSRDDVARKLVLTSSVPARNSSLTDLSTKAPQPHPFKKLCDCDLMLA
jgi:hypothetical protein